MTYTSLRLSGVQRIRAFEVNDDSIRGTSLTSKPMQKHGQFRPWAGPRVGITGNSNWIQPSIDMRDAFFRQHGSQMNFTFMGVDRMWEPVAADAAPYSTTRRKLPLMCVALGDSGGETYTLHSPKNLLLTSANQMSFDQRELNIVGQ